MFSQSAPFTMLAVQCNENIVFSRVEQMPKIEGGVEKLEKALNQKIKLKRTKHKTACLSYKFMINCSGEIASLKEIANQLGEDANKILLYIRSNVKWSAPKHQHHAVDCYYTLDIMVVDGKIEIHSI